jgi:hypothetical protein
MPPIHDPQQWQADLLAASRRRTPEEESVFLRLVDDAAGSISPTIAATLLKTFSEAPDFGTQERVCSVLATGDDRTVLNAILCEMPRLLRDAPEWAVSLLCGEVEFREQLFWETLATLPPDVRIAVAKVATCPDFVALQPRAATLLARLSERPDA